MTLPHPLGDHVLVRQDAERKTIGSLHLPDNDSMSSERFPPYGTVLAIGRDVLDVAVGDRVLFARRGGTALVPSLESDTDGWEGLLMLRCPPHPVQREGKPWQGDIVAVVSRETGERWP